VILPTLEQLKDKAILERVILCGWNRKIAAKSLGIDIKTLRYSMHRLKDKGLEVSYYRRSSDHG